MNTKRLVGHHEVHAKEAISTLTALVRKAVTGSAVREEGSGGFVPGLDLTKTEHGRELLKKSMAADGWLES